MARITVNDVAELFKRTHIDQSAERAHNDAPETTPRSPAKIVEISHEYTGDDCVSHFANYTPSKDSHHRRVDSSHEEGAENPLFFKSQLIHSREELTRVKSELRRSKEEIDELRREVECSKARSDLLDELRVQVATYQAKSTEELSKRQDRIKRSSEVRAELERYQDKIKHLEERDGKQEMKLDGRASTILDDIHFKKLPVDDLSMKVTLSRTFTFTRKQWSEYGILKEARDDAAVACMRVGGRLYNAKAGRTRKDFGDFINSDHWTTEAMKLAKSVGHTTCRRYATHAEPQLMAFYITRTLRESGHQLVDFGDSSKHAVLESNAELRCIEISVSQPICGRCTDFTIKVNEFAKNYGYCFAPIDRS